MQEDIHSLIGKFFSGQASAEEAGMVQKWASATEENAADFAQLQKLWNRAGEQEQQVFDTEGAWKIVDEKLRHTKSPGKTVRMFTRRAVVAAAVVVLLSGAWWIYFSSVSAHTIVADTAMKKVRMEDGSIIFLRKGASLQYTDSYGKNNRNVKLDGEAFFEIMRDTSLPFIISAAKAQVQVLGTSFLVNSDNDSVLLVVKTGRVSFSSLSDTANKLLVIAGEKAMYAGNSLTKQNNINPNFNAWQTKQLLFENTPFSRVAADLSDYYNVTITIKPGDAATISETKLNARFNDQPLQSVLNEISNLSAYRITQVSDRHYEISVQ